MSIATSLFDPDRSAERLPVSLITGFLGSGKTTLLNRLLQRPEMADSAVIINEFGEVALDHLLIEPVTGEAVVLASGCVCCAVRGDLQDALRRLLVQRDRGEVPAFSRMLIETSGLADPAPVVQLLLNNPLLGHDLRLDTVATTVDATSGFDQIEQYPEALKQAAIADRLLVTKTDIAPAGRIEALIRALQGINPGAPIETVLDGEIDPAKLFGASLSSSAIPRGGSTITPIMITSILAASMPLPLQQRGRSTGSPSTAGSVICERRMATGCCASKACFTWRIKKGLS